MTRHRCALLVALALPPLLAGCGGGSAPRATAPTPGYMRKVERIARDRCRSVGLKRLSARLKVAATVRAVSSAYADTWPANVRGAAFTGCSQGLEGS